MISYCLRGCSVWGGLMSDENKADKAKTFLQDKANRRSDKARLHEDN